MRFDNTAILGLEYVTPPHAISSASLMKRLAETCQRTGMRPDLLEEVAGIRSRYFWDEETMPSDAAALAGNKVMDATGIDRDRLGLLVNTSVSRDYLEPSTACFAHGAMGLGQHCASYDLGNACLAFLDGMNVAAAMLERGATDYALIVDGESSRPVTEATIERLQRPETTPQDFHRQFAALTLGSVGVAMVLGRADEHPDCTHRYLGGVALAATQHRHLCRGTMEWMETDTRGLLEAGIELASMTWVKGKKELGWKPEDLDEVVLHQVSRVHTAAVLSALQADPEKAHLAFPDFGNVGPAGLPLVLAQAVELGRVPTGARVGLMGIGSGLNCAMSEVVW